MRLLIFIFCLTQGFCNSNELDLQEWLGSSTVLKRSYKYEDAIEYIKTNPNATKGWATDLAPTTHCSLIYKAKWGRIWSMGFLYNVNVLFIRDKVVPVFKENDYVLIPFWGEIEGWTENLKYLLKNAKHPDNFFFLTNNEISAENLRKEGLQAFCVSHNAFIDPNTFHPVAVEKQYDAVYLGDCRAQKRLTLAQEILPKLEVITFNNEEQREVVASAAKIIQSPPIENYSKLISQAYCGIMFSSAEGGCYASTEYLYCGIPVVSTHSLGGRDSYYDDVTAIIVDDNPQAIKRGVDTLVKRNANPWEVRMRALAVSDKMLNTLAYEVLQPIFIKYGDTNSQNPRLFVSKIINKSKKYSSKGRTLFQPEDSNHKTLEKIIRTQNKPIKYKD